MSPTLSMLKRFILAALTIIVVIHMSLLLFKSLNEPQITNQLELYQTDLLLHATELSDESSADTSNGAGNRDPRRAFLGEDPLKSALEQYQTVRKSAEGNLTQFQKRLADLPPSTSESTSAASQEVQTRSAISQQQASLNELDLRIGILQAKQQDTTAAIQTWTSLQERFEAQTVAKPFAVTTDALIGLWDTPPRLLPDAEQQLQKNLDGWFRYVALSRLYELQQRPDALSALQQAEQAIAQQTLVKLALVSTVPLVGSLIGAGLLIFLVVQRVLRGKQSLLEQNATLTWDTPWDWETIVLVVVAGFFLVGQILVPLVLSVVQLGLSRTFSEAGASLVAGGRAKAIYALTFYATMASATLLVMYLAIKKFLPLPDGWFRLGGGRSFLWGIGGYFIALPLMILVSLVNQQIWQGQGGSNPLLQIVLEEADPVALAIFFLTAAIAAPLFEETLFRGFLLPSLTRYVPVWGAITISSLIFAIAHLSFSEILPLTLLGAILGIVYTRSRSLLSPMILHSLWNSATMISLLILGSGGS